MKIDIKSPCGSCGKYDRCKVESKDNVRSCGRYEEDEFYKNMRKAIKMLEGDNRKNK